MMVSELDWAPMDLAYLAGLLDGEGTIGIMRKTRNGHIWHELVIATTLVDGQELLPDLAEHFGGSALRYKHAQGHYYWRWTVYTQEAARLLLSVSPYLRLKCREAVVALRFARLPRCRGGTRLSAEQLAERETLRLALKALHKKEAV